MTRATVDGLEMEKENNPPHACSRSNNLEWGRAQEKGFKAVVLEHKWTQICLTMLPVSAQDSPRAAVEQAEPIHYCHLQI